MSDKPHILFSKPGAISHGDRSKLGKAGILVVEVDDPQSVKLAAPESTVPIQELSHGELLVAAANAIAASSSDLVRVAFGKAVAEALIARHAILGIGNPHDQ